MLTSLSIGIALHAQNSVPLPTQKELKRVHAVESSLGVINQQIEALQLKQSQLIRQSAEVGTDILRAHGLSEELWQFNWAARRPERKPPPPHEPIAPARSSPPEEKK